MSKYAFPAGLSPGMTLRDWFAGMVLSGEMAADVVKDDEQITHVPTKKHARLMARRAYAMADAMLSVRLCREDKKYDES